VEGEVRGVIRSAREAVERFDPELVVLFAPDHFNAFFYDMMPPFCIGVHADSIGDYGSQAGPLSVATQLAAECAEAAMAAEIDVSLSYCMQVDHGFSQPLELLAGALDRYPVIPVFVNGAAPPRPSCRRVRLLGDALGRHLAVHRAAERILIIGSGGISHDPPIPSIASAPPDIVGRLTNGRNPPVAVRRAKEARVIQAGRDFAAASPDLGGGELLPLNPAWDRHILELLRAGRFDTTDYFEDAWITAEGGRGGHEIRAWIAAFACMAAFGAYDAEISYYRAIPEWIAGFAAMHATSAEPATCLGTGR
jgi:2,3-dihydroxyphenylpropionate 1,2-dioxygenase